ncbi:MAG: hypothetical protein FJ241_11180 [Nitrospira sp.]|nr:hypothetical protein [Nitrospira sp.]
MPKIIIKPEGPGELKTLVKGALENEIKILTIGLKKTQENLQKLEERYKMDSSTFYERYSTGEIGDNIEYIRWAGEFETLKKLQRNLKELSEAKVC